MNVMKSSNETYHSFKSLQNEHRGHLTFSIRMKISNHHVLVQLNVWIQNDLLPKHQDADGHSALTI